MSSFKRVKITLRVNLIVFLISCLLICVIIFYDINFLRYKAPIPYNEWKTIEWSDFRAVKQPGRTVEESEQFATIFSEIRIKFADEHTVQVQTYFHPARSYTYSENQVGKALITHELYHLHIAEYYSRLIRKKIATIVGPVSKSIILEVAKDYKKKEREMQYRYDNETNHSYVYGKQKEWQHKIDSCLLDLNMYSNEIVKF